MSDSTIPERAIEAGARALRFNESSGMCELDRACALCDYIDPKTSDGYARLHARKALESAAPYIAAQALRDAAAALVTGKALAPADVLVSRWLIDRADEIEADHG